MAWGLGQRWHAHRQIVWTGPDSPYPGLEAFTEDRTEVFFGREDETAEAERRLVVGRESAQRFLTVVGPSGCGKSSFVAAGVLPRLKKRRWTVLGPLRLGSAPFTALAQALAPERSEFVPRLASELRREAAALTGSGEGIPEACLSALLSVQRRRSRIVLVIDQFEDVIRLVESRERDLFLRSLRAAVRAKPDLHVIVTLTSGSLHDPALGPYDDLFRTRMPLSWLTPRQTNAVITGPARAAGADIAEDVVDDLLVETTEAGSLPLLSQLLRNLYEAAGSDHVIGRELLERTGPLSEAIARHAERLYQGLVAVYPLESVEAVLLKFVSWDERGISRQTVRAASLDARGLAIAEELRAARLVTDVDEGAALDLVHEAVLKHWPRLRALIDSHQVLLRRITELERRAAAWEANDRSADDLLHGQRLVQARELAASHAMSVALSDLVAASEIRETDHIRARADDIAERAQQAYALQEDDGLALALAVAAVREFTATEKSALTLWGIGQGPTTETIGVGHAEKVIAMGWDPTTGNLRTIGAEGDLCNWTGSGDLIGQEPLGDGALTRAGFSGGADAYWLEGPGGLGVLRFSDPDFSPHTRAASVFGDRTVGLSFDGRRAAAQLDNSGVDIVDFAPVTEGQRPDVHSFEAPPVQALKWSPDSALLAMLARREVHVVRVSDGERLWSLACDADAPSAMSKTWFDWSPDGRRMAETAGRTLRIRAAEDGAVLDEWGVGEAAVGVFWSPDGCLLAVINGDTGADRNITVWRIADRAVLRRLGVRWGVEEVVWSADSFRFAWRSELAGAWLCDCGSWRPRALLSDWLSSVSWNAGRVAVTLRGHDAVYVAEPVTSARLRKVTGGRDPKPGAVAWAPNGDSLAVSFSGRVEIWNVASRRCTTALTTQWGMVDRFAWSPDGTLLATASHDFVTVAGRIEVWSTGTGQRVAEMDGADRMARVLAWSPDGRRLLGAEEESPLVAWDPLTGSRSLSITVEAGTAQAACWSPNGRKVAFLDGAFRIQVCDAQSGEPLLQTVPTYGAARSLHWAPDGRFLAAAGDGWVSFWSVATGECQAVSRLEARLPLDARWSDDGCTFTATAENHRQYVWSLPEDSVSLACETLLEQVAEQCRELTAEERRRYGLPA
ncbi:AAA family ATPase [Streptomyces sp. HC44]|uniref:AAA family ATPase n=1 Tax=Streptomyces scabichelini TaxID=2711217 RepID=A0A6G4VIC0_9ACTN|nr:AAA family ATPase [Streptomyces scabichelini]